MSFGDEEIALGTETSCWQDLFGLHGPGIEFPWTIAHERKYLVRDYDWGDEERLLYACRKYHDACLITGHTSAEAFGVVAQVENLYMSACPLNRFGRTLRNSRKSSRCSIDREIRMWWPGHPAPPSGNYGTVHNPSK